MEQLPSPLEDRMHMKNIIIFFSVLSLLIGVILLWWFICKVSDSHSIPKDGQILGLSSFGAFGDFIGGVVGTLFSLTGVFLLFLTLSEQRENFHKERLESNFFELVKFHRDNVNEIQYTYYESQEEKVTAERRKVFKLIFAQFKDAWQELDQIFSEASVDNIYEDTYINEVNLNNTIKFRKIDLKNFAQIDIVYSIVFFGLGREGTNTILKLVSKRYRKEFISEVLRIASMKPMRESIYWENWVTISALKSSHEIFSEIINKRRDDSFKMLSENIFITIDNQTFPFKPYYPDNYNKYYGGHQFRLDHYFRHIYQTVKFINDELYLSDIEKYSYIKILRGQLSNYEQIIFFLNSISEIGRVWEFSERTTPGQALDEKEQLITKYNLIKNIPERNIVPGVDILSYYPSVNFEVINKD